MAVAVLTRVVVIALRCLKHAYYWYFPLEGFWGQLKNPSSHKREFIYRPTFSGKPVCDPQLTLLLKFNNLKSDISGETMEALEGPFDTINIVKVPNRVGRSRAQEEVDFLRENVLKPKESIPAIIVRAMTTDKNLPRRSSNHKGFVKTSVSAK